MVMVKLLALVFCPELRLCSMIFLGPSQRGLWYLWDASVAERMWWSLTVKFPSALKALRRWNTSVTCQHLELLRCLRSLLKCCHLTVKSEHQAPWFRVFHTMNENEAPSLCQMAHHRQNMGFLVTLCLQSLLCGVALWPAELELTCEGCHSSFNLIVPVTHQSNQNICTSWGFEWEGEYCYERNDRRDDF